MDDIIVNPFDDEDLDEDLDEEEDSYRTYRMDVENKRIIGMVEGLEASVQDIYKALKTRRFAHLIYDEQYGCDVYNKIGNLELSQEYLDSDIPAMVEDTFANDEMVLGISDLAYKILDGDGVHISFAVSTIFGDANFEEAVTDG